MGPSDDDVVDPSLRVRGVHHLRLVDCSVLRHRVVSGNLNGPGDRRCAWRDSRSSSSRPLPRCSDDRPTGSGVRYGRTTQDGDANSPHSHRQSEGTRSSACGMQLARPMSGPLLAVPPSKSSTVWRRVPTLRGGTAATRCDPGPRVHLARRRGCAARAHFETGNGRCSRASIAPQRASTSTQLSHRQNHDWQQEHGNDERQEQLYCDVTPILRGRQICEYADRPTQRET